jgi:hypothetical protein
MYQGLALRTGDDPRRAGRRLRRALDEFVLSRTTAPFVRAVVADSWRRCAAAGVRHDDGRPPAIRMAAGELAAYRSAHPLAGLLPVFRDLLGELASDGRHLLAVTDAHGVLLWVEGEPALRRRAERMGFVEGASWAESEAGTNAPGMALALRQPVQIFAGEHYHTTVHPWSCSAAPIHDPASGRLLGAIDLTGGLDLTTPHVLGLVRAAARAAEAELVRDRPTDPVEAPPAGGVVGLAALGRDHAQLGAAGRPRRLSLRHSEIMVALVLAAGGATAERLAVELYEHEVNPVTVRAEMSRLRALVGPDLLGSLPYRLRRPVRPDFLVVRDLLAEGRLREAVAAYPGPLLPASEAPTVVEYRRMLEQQLRGALLASGDPVLLRGWVDAPWGADDASAWRALARCLPPGSPQRAAAVARATALV